MSRAFVRPDLEQAATLGGARRTIPWEELDANELAPEDRLAVGMRWRSRYEQEHLAVGAFAKIAWEVAACGGEPVVLALLTRAASDEVRHAEICRRAAACFLGDDAVPARLRGVPPVPPHPDATPTERALYHAVEMGCLSETFTGVYLTETLAQTTHPTMRAVLESLLEDEIDHGRVGWAHLAAVARVEPLDGLRRALPDMLRRTFVLSIRKASKVPEPDVTARAAVGHLSNDACPGIFRRALRDVILPGFETLGVDLGPTMATIRAEGWLVA
jgi:hypothetical protein